MSLPLVRGLRVLVLGSLAALALPGVHAAAEADLVPPVAKLFAWNAEPAPASGPASCAANQAAALPMAELRRRAAMARIAALVNAEPGGSAQPLNGRGHAYPVQRDPNMELRQIVMEAQRQRARRAAEAP